MTGLLWLPPPENHLCATYRPSRGLGDRNRASHRINDSKIWEDNVGTLGPGNLCISETSRDTTEGKSLLDMNRDEPTLSCSFDDSRQIQQLNIGSFVLKWKDGKLKAFCRAPELPQKPQTRAGGEGGGNPHPVESGIGWNYRPGELCTKFMAVS